jgi:hypothetical protein
MAREVWLPGRTDCGLRRFPEGHRPHAGPILEMYNSTELRPAGARRVRVLTGGVPNAELIDIERERPGWTR